MRSTSSGEESGAIDVYDRDGALVGSVPWAFSRIRRPEVRNRLLAGVIRDELAVESVAVYRIER